MPRPSSAGTRSRPCSPGSSASPAGRPRSRAWPACSRSTSGWAACACATPTASGSRSTTRGCRSGRRRCCAARSRSSRSARGGSRSTACPRRHRRAEAVQPAAAARAAVQPAPRRHRPAVRRCARAGRAGPRRGRDLRPRRQRRHGPRRRARGRAPRPAPHRPADRPARPRRPGSTCPRGTLSIDLQGSETGGLLAAATGRPEAGALRLSLTGDGPLSGWQGRLAVDAERLAKLDLAVDLAYAERKQVSVTGALDAAPGALPRGARRHHRHARRSLGSGRRDGPATLRRRGARRCRRPALRLSGNGSADLAADTVEGCRARGPARPRAVLRTCRYAARRGGRAEADRQRRGDAARTRPCRHRHGPAGGEPGHEPPDRRLRGRVQRAARRRAGGPARQGDSHDRRAGAGRPHSGRRTSSSWHWTASCRPGARRSSASWPCARPWARSPATPASIASGSPAPPGSTPACPSSRP